MNMNPRLPWKQGDRPLMLAPMQGLTNKALRGLFIERFHPDVVFTEYIQVKSSGRKFISESDRREVEGKSSRIPLVVQLIGSDTESMVNAALVVQELGGEHININLGCPYGRMMNSAAGGALLLQSPDLLAAMLTRLRASVRGSLSVKVRSGFEDSSELLSLVGLFEDCGIDFLVVHPRTVRQRYSGAADHSVTAEVVRRSSLPVIANGDVFTGEDGRRVFELTGSAGLMLGRGAIADPFLFERIRGRYEALSTPEKRVSELRDYLLELVTRYQDLFCGDRQVLDKMKEVLNQIKDPECQETIRELRKSRKLSRFSDLLHGFA